MQSLIQLAINQLTVKMHYLISLSLVSTTLLDYSEVPNRRADRNKRAGLERKCHPACLLLSKLINEQG